MIPRKPAMLAIAAMATCLGCGEVRQPAAATRDDPPAAIQPAKRPAAQRTDSGATDMKRQAGFRVPGSSVSLPQQVAAGSTLTGAAPAGSRVEAFGQQIDVPQGGRFELQVPSDTRDSFMVRIHRPGMTTLALRVRIAP